MNYTLIKRKIKPREKKNILCVVFINLTEHTHRKEHMENMLQMLRLPYIRFNAICPTIEESIEIKNIHNRVKNYLHNENTISRGIGVIGCYLSHLSVLQTICPCPQQHICILEDDLKFDLMTLFNVNRIISYLDENCEWDMFRIIRNKFDNDETHEFTKHVVNNIPFYKIGTPHYQSIYKNKKNNSINGGTYFQIINTKNIPKIIDYLEKEDVYNVDAIYSTNQLNVFYGFNKDLNIEINLFDSSIPKEKQLPTK